jgi:hypothetical protein
MELLAEFKQYEQTVQTARSEYIKYEKIFLEDGTISDQEDATLSQLAKNIQLLENGLDSKKLEKTLTYVQQEVDKEDEKCTVDALGILGDMLAGISMQCKKTAAPQLEAIYAKAEPVVANLSADTAKASDHDCGDYWAGGNPFVRISYYSPSCMIQYANLDIKSRKPYVGEWERDNVNTALFKVFSTVVIYRVGKIFKTVEWLGIALGMTNASIQGYTGLHVRYRIKGETIVVHNWYGRCKYNFVTGNILAIDFQGTGKDNVALIAPFTMEYGLFDHKGTFLGSMEEEWDEMIGLNIDSYTVLPEKSFGTF